jgi:hypothetical protein
MSEPYNSPQHPTAARFARPRRVSGKSRYADSLPRIEELIGYLLLSSTLRWGAQTQNSLP